jgi:hypothetical protein
MHFELISSPRREVVFDQPENAGFDQDAVVRLLDDLQRRGHSYQMTGGERLSEDARSARYGEAVAAVLSSGGSGKIRSVFGSRKHGGGRYFGREVPALLVYRNREASTPADVLPHQNHAGDYRTIVEFLQSV